MAEQIIVSGERGISAYAISWGEPMAMCALNGAGAVCTGRERIYVANERENTIWCIDGRSLRPLGVFSGGPGISQLMLSGDGKHLYALCSDGDGLLMLCAGSGEMELFCRVGVNPCAMAMDESGDVIAVAGGACGEVFLLNAYSLFLRKRLSTCGMVFSVALSEKNVYALSLTETMDSVLSVFFADGSKRELFLPGMPGTLRVLSEDILAATHRGLFFISRDVRSVFGCIPVAGRAGHIHAMNGGILMTDLWTESLFWLGRGMQEWKCVAQGIKDAAVLKLFD